MCKLWSQCVCQSGVGLLSWGLFRPLIQDIFLFSLFVPLEFLILEMFPFKMKFFIRIVHTGVIGVNGDMEHSRSHTSFFLGAERGRDRQARGWTVYNCIVFQKGTSGGGKLNRWDTPACELLPRSQYFEHRFVFGWSQNILQFLPRRKFSSLHTLPWSPVQ